MFFRTLIIYQGNSDYQTNGFLLKPRVTKTRSQITSIFSFFHVFQHEFLICPLLTWPYTSENCYFVVSRLKTCTKLFFNIFFSLLSKINGKCLTEKAGNELFWRQWPRSPKFFFFLHRKHIFADRNLVCHAFPKTVLSSQFLCPFIS